jgi:hypothetical protein
MAKSHKMAFKFLTAEFAASFIERGSLRIGTAAEFRRDDGLDGGRSDTNELSAEWAPGEVTIPLSQEHPLVDWYGLKNVPKAKNTNGGINLQLSSGTILKRVASAYMFCASCELTSNMIERMANDFSYDACVRIGDFAKFGELISSHPSLQGRFHGLDRVTYKASIAVDDLSETGVFVKQMKYGWQKETRIVWGGDNIPETGHVIEVPSIIPLLRRVF